MSAFEEIQDVEEVDAAIRENPFKFLDYYDEDDASVFAGRSEEVMRILADFTRSRTFTLYGRTGLGKTSLLRAGLFPRLRDLGYLPIYIRLLDHPVDDLLNAVRRALGDPSLTKEDLPARLAGVSELAAADDIDDSVRPVVLVLDQFEELFIRFERRPDERKALRVLLREIASFPNSSVSILFSLREDYVAQMDDLQSDLPDVMTQSYRLLPLTAYGAREAILLSLKRASIEADATVLNALITELEARGFSPLVLQIYCTELYRAARKRNPAHIRFTEADMAAVGDIQAIHEKSLAELVKRLSASRALLLCCVLDVLKSADRTKLALRIADVVHPELAGPALSSTVYFLATEDDATWALNYLVSRRIVRKVPGEEGWFELLHDGMVPAIESWLPKNAQFVKFQQARISVETLSMFSAHLRQDYLLEGVQPWKHLLRLSATATAYVFRSVVLEQIDDVPYWAARYDTAAGAGSACTALAEWLDAEVPTQRAAAATAAGRLGAAELSKKVLTLALDDKSSEVRARAAEAVARLGDFDVARLRRACWKQRSRAIDVLAAIDLHSPDQMHHFSRLARLAARDRGVRKQVRFDPGTNQRRLAFSAGIGAAVGVLWALVVLPLLLSFFGGSLPTVPELGTSKMFLIFAPGIAACIGALMAWRTCLRVDRFATLDNQSDTALKSVGGGWTQMLLVTLLAAVVVNWFDPDLDRLHFGGLVRQLLMALPFALLIGSAIKILTRKERRRPYPAAIDAVAVLGLGTLLLRVFDSFYYETLAAAVAFVVAIVGLLTPMAVAILRPATREFASIRTVGIWPFIATALPVAILLAVAGAVIPLRDSLPLALLTHLGLMLFAAAVLMTFTVPVVAMSLAIWKVRSHGQTELPPQPPTFRVRLLLVTSAAAIVPLVLWVFGPHSVALVPQIVDRTEAIIVPTRPWPTVHHLAYRRTAGIKIADVGLAVECENCKIVMRSGAPYTGEFLSTADQVSKFSVASEGARSGSRLRIVSSPLSEGGLRVASPGEWRLVSLPMQCISAGMWVGEWNGRIPSYPAIERVVVQPISLVYEGNVLPASATGETYPGGGRISFDTRLSALRKEDGLSRIDDPSHAGMIDVRTLPDGSTYLLLLFEDIAIPCTASRRGTTIQAIARITRTRRTNRSYRDRIPPEVFRMDDEFEKPFGLYRLASATNKARYENEAVMQNLFIQSAPTPTILTLAEKAVATEPLNAEYWDTLAHSKLAVLDILAPIAQRPAVSFEIRVMNGGFDPKQLWREALSAHERSLQLGGTRDPICRYDAEFFAKPPSWLNVR